jgi:hypothetical protein
MGKAVKIAISIPQEAFKKLEANRNREGITRSKFVLKTLRFWEEEKEKERLVSIYEEGYKRIPENPRELEAWEKVSSGVFSQGEW